MPVTAADLIKIHSGSPETNGYFGWEVGLSGDGLTAVVGAPGESSGDGNAYVFALTAPDTWTLTATLNPSTANTNGYYGTSVAINQDGTTIAVGGSAPGLTATAVGLVDIWIPDGIGGWEIEATVNSPDAPLQQSFGAQVRLSSDGDRLVVADPLNSQSDGSSPTGHGNVYVLTRTAGVWAYEETLYPTFSDTQVTGIRFGSAIAVSGDGNTIAATAAEFISDSAIPHIPPSLFPALYHGGAFWIFERDGGGSWSQNGDAKWGNTDPPGTWGRIVFGFNIVMSRDGDYLATGGSGDQWDGAEGNVADNTVTIYTRDDAWAPTFQASGADAPDEFMSAAFSQNGEWLLVGSGDAKAAYAGGAPSPAGTPFFATLLRHNVGGGTWEEIVADLLPGDVSGSQNSFGSMMQLSDNGVGLLIGGTGDNEDATQAGAAWVFGPTTAVALSLDGIAL